MFAQQQPLISSDWVLNLLEPVLSISDIINPHSNPREENVQCDLEGLNNCPGLHILKVRAEICILFVQRSSLIFIVVVAVAETGSNPGWPPLTIRLRLASNSCRLDYISQVLRLWRERVPPCLVPSLILFKSRTIPLSPLFPLFHIRLSSSPM